MREIVRALEIIQGLMEWKPDDLGEDEMPAEWIEAERFLARHQE